MLYFDNAATTQMSDVAIEALLEVTRGNYGNPSSIHSVGRRAREIIERARQIIANCIGALPEEIYFTSGGTESDNWAISQCIPQKVDKIITTEIEHHAVLNPVKIYEKQGINTIYLPVDEKCLVSKGALKAALAGEKVLASIMLQNNETGIIQDVKEFAEMVHADNKDSVIHTDAVQAVGHIKIDVKKMGVDMLSASAHKFNGPKGIGFLYVNKRIKAVPFIHGGGQEKGMRSGTENVAEIYSMARALEDNNNVIDQSREHIGFLERIFLEELQKSNVDYCINGDIAKKANGVLNISVKDTDGEGVLNILDTHGICISTGSACNSKSKEQSYVLSAMKLSEERIDSAIRISVGRFNTEIEVKELAKRIAKVYETSLKVL